MYKRLITTKLYAPVNNLSSQIQREQLFNVLDTSLEHKVTLVTAPAGFGKTTLVTQWLQQSNYLYTWLSLDHHDNLPSRLMAYIIGAMQRISSSIGQAITLDSIPIDPAIAELIDDIAQYTKPIILVLDDVHVLQDDAPYTLLQTFLDHQPTNLHCILISRSEPPLTLARLRGRGQLVEIRAADLRFSFDESTELLNAILHLGLDNEELSQLYHRTEGWIVGLRLAALALQSSQIDNRTFLQGFGGTDRYIDDYLVEEVLNHQSIETREFLLQTSILDSFTAELCDAVRQRKDSSVVLSQIERANLFLSL